MSKRSSAKREMTRRANEQRILSNRMTIAQLRAARRALWLREINDSPAAREADEMVFCYIAGIPYVTPAYRIINQDK